MKEIPIPSHQLISHNLLMREEFTSHAKNEEIMERTMRGRPE